MIFRKSGRATPSGTRNISEDRVNLGLVGCAARASEARAFAFHVTMKPGQTRGRISKLVVMLAVGSLAAAQSSSFDPSGRFLLHPPAAGKIFEQCSRSAPSAKSELWEPSAKDLDDLEASLAKYLDQREKAGKTVPPKETKYHRQYVGFIRNRERYIYGNFYPALDDIGNINEARQAVQVCDGGLAFWGIVYRLKDGTFEDPQFNGIG
jgi:hypothetical protein